MEQLIRRGFAIAGIRYRYLIDHMVFCPKYSDKILVGDMAMVAEGVIRATCSELLSPGCVTATMGFHASIRIS